MTSTDTQSTVFPTWFTTRQEAALARYESLPVPKRGDETWRFSNLKQLDFDGFSRSVGVPPTFFSEYTA